LPDLGHPAGQARVRQPGEIRIIPFVGGHASIEAAAHGSTLARNADRAMVIRFSLDGGKTWRAARVTGRGGSYAAVFRAPPGARVTLRTSASDAAGGSVTETITRAYQVGS
jgi:hypothetical protein